jgi:hypothetical protein
VTIDLLLVGPMSSAEIPWPHGKTLRSDSSVTRFCAALETLRQTTADAVLLWDPRLGTPNVAQLESLLRGRGDVWHAGLLLGMAGQPGLLDFVAPNWMFNCDAPADREVTSWRVSAAACLIRSDVLKQIGSPSPDFDRIAGALLEWAHRAISRGVLMRHVPALLPSVLADLEVPTLDDEVRLVAYRYGRFWARWSVGRASVTGYASPPALWRALQRVPRRRPYDEPAPYQTARTLGAPDLEHSKVTVLIPTVDRYSYLTVVLENLREQTVRPHEIIVIDQTAKDKRDLGLATVFSDLPIRWMYQDEPGQCVSRNAGLAVSTGEFVLFIDDDDEVPPQMIEDHLRSLARFDADVSSGVAQEVDAAPLAVERQFVRASDVFPTNNSLIRRDVLYRSGLFDLAFNRAPRADGELGMRIYLSGAFMVLDQRNSVLHHHAPEGGLRTHKARVITYRASREKLTKRHLPHISEIYLVSRHFTPRQQREMIWLRTFGTLSSHGGPLQRLAKAVVGGVMLPDTIKQTLERRRTAAEWLTRFPQIDQLEER